MGACRKQFHNAFGSFGCGQCLVCRINKRRGLVNRLMCESYFHTQMTFITLTVDDSKVTESTGALNQVLDTSYVQSWLNRFRMRVAPTRIRYFLIGEYGPGTLRPHYHAILFGYPPCPFGGSRNIVYRSGTRQCRCDICTPVFDTWAVGDVSLDEFNFDSAAYVAGYVVDKINEKKRPGFESIRLNSDGLGVKIVPLIVDNPDVLASDPTFNTLSHGGKVLPMSKYLKGKIRDALSKKFPEEVALKKESSRIAKSVVEQMRMRSQEFKEIRKEALENGNLTNFQICKYELDKKNQVYLNKVAKNKQFKKGKL